MGTTPILLMSFDRPDYLKKVLESLKAQVEIELKGRTIALFQDGGMSTFTGKQHGSEEAIEQSIARFREAFPSGIVRASPINLGVAMNFDRAERFAYEELGAETAIFLEDDLVLGGHYLATVDRLISQFAHDERVGYVAAYGDHNKSLDQQLANSQKFIGLAHNWAFALYKRQWLRMRPRVLEYLDVIKNCDYRDKDGGKIKKLFASWGYGDPAISQDAAKTIACCMDGVIKLNTYVCNATYIGERGLHMNEKIFAERGYSKTVLFPKDVQHFDSLDDIVYNRLLAEQRGWAKSSGSPTRVSSKSPNSNRSAPASELPLLSGDPIVEGQFIRESAKAFVSAAYRSLLHREPDADGYANYMQLYAKDKPLSGSIQRTISGLLKSGEFSRKWEAEYGKMPGALLLSIQHALLDRVVACLRGVTCAWTSKEITLRFIFDGEIDDSDRNAALAVAAIVSSDFPPGLTMTKEVIRLDSPADRRNLALQSWAYMRKEGAAA